MFLAIKMVPILHDSMAVTERNTPNKKFVVLWLKAFSYDTIAIPDIPNNKPTTVTTVSGLLLKKTFSRITTDKG